MCNISVISWSSYIRWDADDVCFVLDQPAKLDFNSAISLTKQSIGRHFAPLGYIIPISTQTVFLLNHVTVACLEKKHYISVVLSWVWPFDLSRVWTKDLQHSMDNVNRYTSNAFDAIVRPWKYIFNDNSYIDNKV